MSSITGGLRAWGQTPAELVTKNQLQMAEMKSDLNRHGTREQFGLPDEQITDAKLAEHYITCGRAVEIADIFDLAHSNLNVHGTSLVIGSDIRNVEPPELREAALLAVLGFWRELSENYPDQLQRIYGDSK